MHRLLPLLWLPCISTLHAQLKFELQDGDRVAFLGDAFSEREQYEGWIELAATTRFADRNVSFRNLGWSADTPNGDSRCGLSLLQAGLEPEGEGWRQLQQQLAIYKPSVLLTGYGMAASLPGGMSADEFRMSFEKLLDHAASMPKLRVVVIGAPPRFLREGEKADSPEVRNHREALAAINRVLQDIAEKRGLPFVSLDALAKTPGLSDNGIHLNGAGYRHAARQIESQLGWGTGKWNEGKPAEALRKAILKKNEWFFHRSRPANMAYIFGFRKAEQGRNAGEIEAFDKLVEAEEQRIAKMRDLSKGEIVPEPPARTESQVAANTPQPHPSFTVADGYEVTLWAENPLLHKPTQMNFDEQGRLWVASSETYPQVEVGQTADDKILVLDDTDGDGKADKSTVFAEGMLMPTAVLPGDGGCYVGQSTDLLHFTDTDGDGKADTKRRVLSGFGTEDTHHNLHTLRRGPDGKLWMNQSIYTRTDTETPNGLMRLKSGGIMRFDPRQEKIETVFYGWCNPWGHQFDSYGQSFVTDGAGGGGINWGLPGAMYFTYANAEKVLGSISPGSYPKFCGLEIIGSSNFPAEWQGNMITCDFRAHRVVRFTISEDGAGFAAQEAGDLLRTEDVNFRPIDVKTGPDGALYIADWSNPIINHGEVDFRDPRRDREHGRIWRVQRKGAALTPKRDLAALEPTELLGLLTSDQRHEREQAMALLVDGKMTPGLEQAINRWKASAKDGRTRLAALWLSQGLHRPDLSLLEKVLVDGDPKVRAAAVRVAGDWLDLLDDGKALKLIEAAVLDTNPRVRVEALRVITKLPGAEPMDLAFRVLSQPMDRFSQYALWLNFREHGKEWLDGVVTGKLPLSGRESALEFALSNQGKGKGSGGLASLMPKPLPRDASGPWFNLAMETGDPALLEAFYQQVLDQGFDPVIGGNILGQLAAGISGRKFEMNAKAGSLEKLSGLFGSSEPTLAAAALRMAGALRLAELSPAAAKIAADTAVVAPTRIAAIESLSYFPDPSVRQALEGVVASDAPFDLRSRAAVALSRQHREASITAIRSILPVMKDEVEAKDLWQKTQPISRLGADLTKSFEAQPLAPEVAGMLAKAVPDIDENAGLLSVLRKQAGVAPMTGPTAESIHKLAELAAAQGNAVRGETIYRQAMLACASCHAIGGAGGKVGPDMTSIGASAPMDYLVESVLLPGAKVKEGYHSVIVETKDGRTLIGKILRSGGGSLVLADAAGQEVTLPDEAVLKKTDTGSLMPAGLIANLKEQEQADLFKFLSQLGKPGDFDATKSRAPRVWAVMPLQGEPSAAAIAGDAGLPWVVVNGTVNGRLLAADLATYGGNSSDFLAASRIQLSTPGELVVSFPQGTAPDGIWIDGKPVREGKVSLSAGIHKIVVRIQPGGKDFRFEASAGTFLPTW
ncbi:PVC-type heme-binding CxxCH protein [Luteolibacter luteus]|uniref:C-type cytochrome n=1 Tax=Luteolibacter luteus TaxID=2728835 RepID=A0A858RD58_9BACT|nr:PVC-type heme-binding CxxCH protein [Luteolibacter luteus]QJE94737.1 c-type cytochrome [Luteolibacter luteus]